MQDISSNLLEKRKYWNRRCIYETINDLNMEPRPENETKSSVIRTDSDDVLNLRFVLKPLSRSVLKSDGK